jgi:hypothetical protein
MDSHIQAIWWDVIHANSHATRNGFMAIESTVSEGNGAVPSNVMIFDPVSSQSRSPIYGRCAPRADMGMFDFRLIIA